MIILNLEVVYKDRYIKLFKPRAKNNCGRAIKVIDFITCSKVASRYPSLAKNIERMVCGRIDIALSRAEMQYLVNGVNKYNNSPFSKNYWLYYHHSIHLFYATYLAKLYFKIIIARFINTDYNKSNFSIK